MTRERIIHGLGLIGLTYHFLARQNAASRRAVVGELIYRGGAAWRVLSAHALGLNVSRVMLIVVRQGA